MKLRLVSALVLSAFVQLSAPSSWANTVSSAASNVLVSANLADEKDAAALRAEYIRKNYTKFEYRIPARDGKLLFTSIYVPNDASPTKTYPILLVRTPYTVAPYGADKYKTRLGPSADFEKDGFIFAFQDVRGKNMSEGEFVNMRPHIDKKNSKNDVDESSDTYDSIDWMIKNIAGNNGRVGQWGISYPGFYTSAGVIDSHPALKAVSPQAPIADWFRGDDMHRNGAFNVQLAFSFFSSFGKPRPEPTDQPGSGGFDWGTPDAYQFFLELGPLSNANARYFKNGIPFWNELMQHPNYDSYWQAKNLLPHLKNIKAAVMTVGGWYDTEDLYGPLQTYKAIKKNNPGISNTLVMGPWVHGGWQSTAGDKVGDANFGFKTSQNYQAIEFAFFKHHLKGGDKPALPEAWVFETGANRWRSFDAWPPANTKTKSLYFHANGKLSFEMPSSNTVAFDEYISDPAKPVPYTTEITNRWSNQYVAADQRFAASRPDVLVYQSEVLDRDITFAGPIEANLLVSTTGSDADFVVKLIDVNPNRMEAAPGEPNRGAQQTLVRGEPFRARFRESFEHPKALTPGEPTKVKFAINDVMHTFQRGHRIMIQIQSSWFPFIDRNPQTFVDNIYEAKESDFVKANHRLYRSGMDLSSIKVQVLPALDTKP
ncbi:CocE/NonD family hydrolase [Undibacterium cyanobacteriorum]|uniref:CocE/NonD family hydrolase n=1 Tax=Undibacterium cyanobacteriorum TaxID=3073561 RepID=A0ABY9RGU8_9BURK|nr:CocE/NonD family hydrolase [Undibacterium sp. 20NA77.5]WMW80450.1 CocE/NonD family hydrolase [Undibacterium sp. 20NA77.5]